MMIARARGDTTMEIVGALPEGDKHRLHFLTVVVHGDVVVDDDHPDMTDVIHHGRIFPPSLSCIEVGAIFTQLRPSAQFYTVVQAETSTDRGSGNVLFVLPAAPAFAP